VRVEAPVRVEPLVVEAVRVEPVQVEAVRVEPVVVEAVRVEPVQVEAVQVEPVVVEAVRVEPVHVEAVRELWQSTPTRPDTSSGHGQNRARKFAIISHGNPHRQSDVSTWATIDSTSLPRSR